MSASLHHAQPILAAAINAGFRESGVQSLKNLDDANAFPMIAIRSSGLALESIMGACSSNVSDEDGKVESLVSEDYLLMLLKLANERFKINSERMQRFESDLFGRGAANGSQWEDADVRKVRKRMEGLKKQNQLRQESVTEESKDSSLKDTDGNEIHESGIIDEIFPS